MLQPSEHILLLLAHGVSERVGLWAREATERRSGGHDVFLIDEDAIGSLQERLQKRVQIGHRLLAMLAADVGRNVRHWARSIERNHGGKVIHAGWAELLDVATHAR